MTKSFALGRAEGIRVCSQQDALVCRIAQDVLKNTTWSTSGAAASACRDALDLAESTRAVWCQVVIGGEVLLDEWKEKHNYPMVRACWIGRAKVQAYLRIRGQH